ncbi:MAG: acyl-CoA thioesterase [Flavobacteriaceae bacterium]|nr:acyl-CoA thioesterase [Flavobacteriaceae bacterium]
MTQRSFKPVEHSALSLTELMQPSHSNFSGKIHGGYILSLMDQIAFACASKHAKTYCVTAGVERVDFLSPIEIGELVTLKSSVNYVGKTSMVVGIRVEAENIQQGLCKHCNSSYFTMVARYDDKDCMVPGLILQTDDEVRRYIKAINRQQRRKALDPELHKKRFDVNNYREFLKDYPIQINF